MGCFGTRLVGIGYGEDPLLSSRTYVLHVEDSRFNPKHLKLKILTWKVI